MPENTASDQTHLTDLSADEARAMAEQMDNRGDDLKRRARAWFAYADALDGGTSGAAKPAPAANGGTRATPAAPPSNKRPLILAVITERPDPSWAATEIRRVLIERRMIRPETSAASIRVTLRRMVDKGELAKAGEGRYTLPGHEHEGTLMP